MILSLLLRYPGKTGPVFSNHPNHHVFARTDSATSRDVDAKHPLAPLTHPQQSVRVAQDSQIVLAKQLSSLLEMRQVSPSFHVSWEVTQLRPRYCQVPNQPLRPAMSKPDKWLTWEKVPKTITQKILFAVTRIHDHDVYYLEGFLYLLSSPSQTIVNRRGLKTH